MCMSRRVGQWLLGPEDMSSTKKGIITLFCMTSSCLLGFYVQQRIIEKYYGGEQAEIHRRVNEIKRREMQAIARAGGGDASQIEALGVPKGEGALLNYGRKPDGSLRTDQR